MKTIFLSLLSIILISLIGCEKVTINKEHLNVGLLGTTWEWVSSSGGIAGFHYTPKTIGYTYTVVFTKDGKYEKYDQYNKLVFTYPFALIKRMGSTDHLEHDIIQIENSISYSFQIRKDSLFLYQEANDGFDAVFVRK